MKMKMIKKNNGKMRTNRFEQSVRLGVKPYNDYNGCNVTRTYLSSNEG